MYKNIQMLYFVILCDTMSYYVVLCRVQGRPRPAAVCTAVEPHRAGVRGDGASTPKHAAPVGPRSAVLSRHGMSHRYLGQGSGRDCQRPLCLSDTEVVISVQVKLKTHPWPAGRFSLSGGGRARARSAPARKSLVVHT